ncbi:MAG: hypothetical protein ACC656_00780 [Candidatus Heimdallarchaeota archaeon]
MGKTTVTVLIDGQTLPPYYVDLEERGNVSLQEFLEVMPHGDQRLIDLTSGKRISLNGHEVEAENWFSTYLGGEEIFIAILAGGVVAGIRFERGVISHGNS